MKLKILALLPLLWSLASAWDVGIPYPDPVLTPGMVLTVDTMTLCVAGYSATVRGTTEKQKQEVFQRYGIDLSSRSLFEVDHFIPLCLGGKDVVLNLWPEKYDMEWGARKKDIVESNLHRRMLKHQITPQEAQAIIKKDWVAEYRRIRHLPPPPAPSGPLPPPTTTPCPTP